MAEYISREGVLKAFRITAKNSNKDYQRGLQDAIDCLVPEVIADIPAADVQPVKQWISVKDSVPEAGVNVLVTDGINMMVTWCEYVDNQCLWVDNFYTYVNVRFKEVTHWQPLPEPPKE